MASVRISSKYQLVVPKEIREKVAVETGMVMEMIPFKDRIELIPRRPIQSARGMLSGIDTQIEREDDRL
jgi:AbrB family looped-hinge helix DNA binding protein